MDLATALVNPCAAREPFKGATGVMVTAGEEGAAYCFGGADAPLTGFVPVFKVGALRGGRTGGRSAKLGIPPTLRQWCH
jgi:hypothetical protein